MFGIKDVIVKNSGSVTLGRVTLIHPSLKMTLSALYIYQFIKLHLLVCLVMVAMHAVHIQHGYETYCTITLFVQQNLARSIHQGA